MSSCRPDSFVEVLVRGEGMAARRWRFRYISSERSFAVARSSGGHSRVADVCVTLRSLDGEVKEVHGTMESVHLPRAVDGWVISCRNFPVCHFAVARTLRRASSPPQHSVAQRCSQWSQL